ncbi:MAG TPA: ribonuclease III [Acidimicrobiales bacterium]
MEPANTIEDPAPDDGAAGAGPESISSARSAPLGAESGEALPGASRRVVNGATSPDLGPLVERLGRPFADESLLVRALSHRSWCAEAGGRPSNERMEFLGDAVLGLAVAEHCYRTYLDMPEGALAKVRAAVVNTSVLAEVALELDLGPMLLLGRGEDSSGGRAKPSILANATEAVIAAVYLDGGWDAAEALVLRILRTRIEEAAAGPGAEDFKTRLQEMVVRRVGRLPQYEVAGTGPDHARRYTASVIVGGDVVGQGEGRSKKDAEQAAAHAAWPLFAEPADRDQAEGEVASHA